MLWSERQAEPFRRRAATATANDAIDRPRKELYTPDGQEPSTRGLAARWAC
jgi:hypothetical protein